MTSLSISHAETTEPETGDPGPKGRWRLEFDPRACVGCGQCVGSCPEDALGGIVLRPSGPTIRVDWEACVHCLLCLPWCPTDAYSGVRVGEPRS